MGKVIAMDTPEWARELARHIFTAETKADGGLMEGGYGFLSPKLKERYERIALSVVRECQDLADCDRKFANGED